MLRKKDPGRRGSGIKGVLSNWLGRGETYEMETGEWSEFYHKDDTYDRKGRKAGSLMCYNKKKTKQKK